MEINDNNLNEENIEEKVEDTVEESEGYVSQFSELESDPEGIDFEINTPAEEPKKKFFIFRYINPSIFIAICVFLVALIAFGVYYVFGAKTITGSWAYTVESSESSSADEAEEENVLYYVFDKADSNGSGTYHVYSQGAEQTGTYTISSDNDNKIINMGGSDLYYDIEGIKLFGNATLKLTMPASTDSTTGEEVEEQTVELKESSDPDYESQTISDYKTDDKLTGEWESSDRTFLYYGMYELQYTENVQVSDDGIIKVHYTCTDLGVDSTIYYGYSADNGTLKLKRATSDDEETVKYSVKNGKLTFTDKTTSSIFYDEIFGDVTYTNPNDKSDDSSSETTTEEETTAETTASTSKTSETTAKTTTAETTTK
jgi:hypothetical protein